MKPKSTAQRELARRPRDGRSKRPFRRGQCSVCTHPDQVRIEALRVGGATLDGIATEFGISRDSVHRHFKNHVSEKRKAELLAGPAALESLADAAAKESKSVLEYLAITRSVLFRQLLTAAEVGDRNVLAGLAKPLLESLKEIGKLTGELRQISGISITNNTLNVVGTPQFAALSEGLLSITRKHPEAREDIVALLRGLDEQPEALLQTPPLIEGEIAHD